MGFGSPPFGIIPGGSGNGFAKSLSYFNQEEEFSPLQCCYNVINGQPKDMDLTKLTTDKGQVFYSFLSIAYGFTSDCDIESETLRFLVSFFVMGFKNFGGNLCMYNSVIPSWNSMNCANLWPGRSL